MTLETPAPEAALAPPAGDSPPGDQAPPAPAEQAPPGKPAPTVDPARFNREFTQRSQALASLRDEVGLPATATPTEIVEAVKAKLAAPPEAGVDEDDPIMSDPRVLALQRQAEDSALAYARAEYGEVADFTAELKGLFRKERDPAKQVAAVYEMLSRFAPAEEAPAAPAAGEPSSGQAPPAAEAGLGASEGESPSPIALDQAIVDEFKGTGNVAGFLNRIGLVGPAGKG